jgi:hypothetical protein
MARMLWAFDISPKKRDGKEVPIYPDKLTQGFVCMPEDFECDIKPRSKERANLIREEWAQCLKESIDPKTFQIKPGSVLKVTGR